MFKEEHSLFQKLLSGDLNIDKEDFKKTNADKLVKLVSSHLMLPTFYKKIISGNYDSYFEKDLILYLKEIYLINKARNTELLKEAKILSSLLNENKINHLFLKGTALLFSGIYSDIGERMIGDIDFLISDEDIDKVSMILKSNHYFPYSEDVYIYYRHIPRLIKKDYTFAVEPHVRLVDKKKIISEKRFLSRNKNLIYPTNVDLLLHNIYNFQINDLGYRTLNFSYKSFYDSLLLLDKINLSEINFNSDKYVVNYFVLMNENNLFKKDVDLPISSMRKIMRGFFNNNKVIFKSYIKLIYFIKRVKTFKKQIFVFFLNEKYRKYIYNKIFSKLN